MLFDWSPAPGSLHVKWIHREKVVQRVWESEDPNWCEPFSVGKASSGTETDQVFETWLVKAEACLGFMIFFGCMSVSTETNS